MTGSATGSGWRSTRSVWSASGLLILVPGPNFIGYYFLVRTAGHYLSLRGARQGLVGVTWSAEVSALLTSLRAMVSDAPETREEKVQAVAEALRLEHFARFFQRLATQLRTDWYTAGVEAR